MVEIEGVFLLDDQYKFDCQCVCTNIYSIIDYQAWGTFWTASSKTWHRTIVIWSEIKYTYVFCIERKKKQEGQVQKKPNNTDSCPVAYITTLTCIILKQIPNTFKSLGYTRLKNDLKRHRMCIRRFGERRIINGMCRIRTNVKSPLNKSSVQEHRPVDRSHIKKKPNNSSNAKGTHAVAICWPGHTRRPKPKVYAFRSSLIVPSDVNQRWGLKLSGSGKSCGSRPTDLCSSRIKNKILSSQIGNY